MFLEVGGFFPIMLTNCDTNLTGAWRVVWEPHLDDFRYELRVRTQLLYCIAM